ncbi:MAG TPA: four helix bundle protein [Saprospiraceae bacterium]|nr:four helix bundle protein [Saprospiraceae bacterium]
METPNPLKTKSFSFAIRIIQLCNEIQTTQKEFILTNQLTRSGTSIGALFREAEHAESKRDFIHKLSIAQKECNETLYWLELMEGTAFISQNQAIELKNEGIEILKILTRIILSSKASLK